MRKNLQRDRMMLVAVSRMTKPFSSVLGFSCRII